MIIEKLYQLSVKCILERGRLSPMLMRSLKYKWRKRALRLVDTLDVLSHKEAQLLNHIFPTSTGKFCTVFSNSGRLTRIRNFKKYNINYKDNSEWM